MIQYNPKNWFTLIFQFHRSEGMRTLGPNIVFIGLYTGALCYLFLNQFPGVVPEGLNFHGQLAVVLGLVLVFRTNTAYDRWWEGRKMWGKLINDSRSFAIRLHASLPNDDEKHRRYFTITLSNYATALRDHLRNGTDLSRLNLEGMPYAERIRHYKHVPAFLSAELQNVLNEMNEEGSINGFEYRDLSEMNAGFVDLMGACERIRKTPIPLSYSMYVKKVIFIYLLSLPISMVHSMNYWAIPAIMFITYVMAGIELLAEEIEDPFGFDANDLDTDGMTATIHRDMEEILMKPLHTP